LPTTRRHVSGYAAALAALVLLVMCLLAIEPFLAVTDRVEAQALVMEAWYRDPRAVAECAEEFEAGGYAMLVLVLSTNTGAAAAGSKAPGEGLVESFDAHGVARERIAVVAAERRPRHRTFSRALALGAWLRAEERGVSGINVFAPGVHARKSRLLYARALGPEIRVGVVASRYPPYRPGRWWASWTGIRLVARNAAGYVYARWLGPSPAALRGSRKS
jgi:hypothetical protein